ncbi:MAG: YebC/PmpR family DNA-binding transcriptional regulator [Gemmatimonadota bacterium]|nr:YebC/PmpR family DNA-binding transcriptional regulator [Gemmatimonadota bacterium]
MAGHNKWSQIKRKKGVNDQARGRVFAKIGRELAVAARDGGGDPNFNPRLRLAVDNARAQNMPKDNIERAIKRGTGDLPGTTFEEITYEGYAPGGIALYLQCLTDNANRTVAELRHLLDKRGGNLGQAGSVAWMFERLGQIYLDADACDEESALEAALEAGADNFEAEDGVFVVTTAPADLHEVQKALRDAGLPIQETEVAMVPTNMVKVEGRKAEKLVGLLDAIDEHEDVQRVYSNADLDDADLAVLETS